MRGTFEVFQVPFFFQYSLLNVFLYPVPNEGHKIKLIIEDPMIPLLPNLP